MPRRQVSFASHFWDEYQRGCKKAKLSETQQQAFGEELAELVTGLREAGDPFRDDKLQRWKPQSYGGVIHTPGIQLCEYKLKNPNKFTRVIAAAYAGGDLVLWFCGLGSDHDRIHKRLKTLLRQARAEILDP